MKAETVINYVALKIGQTVIGVGLGLGMIAVMDKVEAKIRNR